MHPTSSDAMVIAIAAISGLFALLLAWRCYHFATLKPECTPLELSRGQISQMLPRRNWYGASQLDLQVQSRWFRVFTGPWIFAVGEAAQRHATVEVGACLAIPRPRAWLIRGAAGSVLDIHAQLAEARGDAKATGVMAFLCAFLSATCFSGRRPAA